MYTRQQLYELYKGVLPYARGSIALPDPWCDSPEHQAAVALWQLILFPGRNPTTRIQALREYYDRIHGKAGQHLEDGEETSGLDLSVLSDEEVQTLNDLLEKAKT